MSRAERAVLLFLLAMCAGASDGWSFRGFGEVFVANMTGNIVLMGISTFRPHSNLFHTLAMLNGKVVHPALALIVYAVGVAIASYVTGKSAPRARNVIWTRAVSQVLAVETVLTAGVEAAWYANEGGAHIPKEALMAVMALCMGMQSGAMLQLRIPGIVTTYLSNTLTMMVQGLTRLAAGERLGPRVEKQEYEDRLAIQAITLAVYLLAAIFSAWAFVEAPRWVGVFPFVCLATVSVWSLLRAGEYSVAE